MTYMLFGYDFFHHPSYFIYDVEVFNQAKIDKFFFTAILIELFS